MWYFIEIGRKLDVRFLTRRSCTGPISPTNPSMVRQRNHGQPSSCDGVDSRRAQPATPRNIQKGIVQFLSRAQNRTCCNRSLLSCHEQHPETAASDPPNSLDGHHPRMPGGGKPTSSSKHTISLHQSRRPRPPAQTFARREAYTALVLIALTFVHPAKAADPTTDYLKPSVSSKVCKYSSVLSDSQQQPRGWLLAKEKAKGNPFRWIGRTSYLHRFKVLSIFRPRRLGATNNRSGFVMPCGFEYLTRNTGLHGSGRANLGKDDVSRQRWRLYAV